MFSYSSWVSIGLKPKAKDLKSVVEDLQQMEYLNNVDYETNIVLDGRKVRIGFAGNELDYLSDKHADTAYALRSLAEVDGDDKPPVSAIIEANLVLNQKLD